MLWKRRAVVGVTGLLIVAGGYLGGCTTTKIPMTDIEVPMLKVPLPRIPLFSRGEGDYRSEEWAPAFEVMHTRIAREYPFTEHKGVSWGALHDECAPKIAAAAAAKDEEAYYLALREYVYAIPDGNVRIEENVHAKAAAIGGGFGFACRRLSDGRVMVHMIDADGPAAKVGMKWGAEIVSWDQKPIQEALKQVSVLWAETPPATHAGRAAEQCRLLTRAPVGAEAVVGFRNKASETPWVVRLKAEADDFDMLPPDCGQAEKEGLLAAPLETPFESRTLENGYGYVNILFQAPTLTTPFPERVFRKIIKGFIDKAAPGLIVDLRHNTGGDHGLAAKYLAYFVPNETVYRDCAFYSEVTETFEVDPEMRLTVPGGDVQFTGPVVVLIDTCTFGSGEGIALALGELPNVTLVGYSATNGSFGITGGDIVMPEGYTLSYPVGRVLDTDGAILIDANAQGQGGVAPDLAVPVTPETLEALYHKEEDPLMAEAIRLLDAAQPEPKPEAETAAE